MRADRAPSPRTKILRFLPRPVITPATNVSDSTKAVTSAMMTLPSAEGLAFDP
jgi:hypothetical protein